MNTTGQIELLDEITTRQDSIAGTDAPPDIREKLETHGPQALNDAELVSMLITTKRGRNAASETPLEMAQRLIKDYSTRSLFSIGNFALMMRETGENVAAACQLLALGELIRRETERAQSGKPGSVQVDTIRTPGDVARRCAEMGDLRKEVLRGLYLNARNKIIHDETISIGTLTANLVHPAEVFRPAIERSAAGVIIIHNHPSGDAEPSDHDISITAQLAQAASILSIKLIDHVIIGARTGDTAQFCSLREKGVL